MKIIKTLLAFTLLIGLSSCATIILGPTQSIGISSSPSKAKIFINGEEIGNTPKTVTLHKKDIKEIWVRIELDGYYPFETVLTRTTSGWVADNILLGGIIGLAVDYITGSAYILSPEQVTAELGNSSASVLNDNKNSIDFLVTLNPEKDWIKIGQLVQK